MHDAFSIVGEVILGQYRVDAVAGEGGFGIVYRGHHLGFDQPIAIKCLKVPTHFTSEARASFLSKFRDEGKILAKLSQHPSIVRVFDLGVVEAKAGPLPYLILEWLAGRTLEEEIRARHIAGLQRMDEHEAIALLLPAVQALGAAHRLGVAHRDIKPPNVFVCRTALGDTVKVLDFGIAKAMAEGDTASRAMTDLGAARAFSPHYGAPEQFWPKRYGATGPWTDVHASASCGATRRSRSPSSERGAPRGAYPAGVDRCGATDYASAR